MSPVRDCYDPKPCLHELAAGGCPCVSEPACDFAEAGVWESLGGGWQSLCGSYCDQGLGVEWHDFTSKASCDWARSFHPGSVEVCLNIAGHGRLFCEEQSVLLGPLCVGFYTARTVGAGPKLAASRTAGERHQFLTVEFSPEFLRRHLGRCETSLHPVIRFALGTINTPVHFAPALPLSPKWKKAAAELRTCPHSGHSATLWYHGKAFELASELFFNTERVQVANTRSVETSRRRVAHVIEVLVQRLADPPTLHEIGRIVGCSPYHLSRTFSRETGMTIPQYLRQIRMEKAAELLKSGKYNVTEAALEVGYNSLSHFSHAFCEVIGCCPGLYPLGLMRPVSGVRRQLPDKITKAAQDRDSRKATSRQ